jgi:hypothetical protein
LYPATDELLEAQFNATECDAGAATPVPLSETLELALLALLKIVALPLAEPATEGANCTPTEVL